MKKLFLVVTVLFISVSASFAFQQTIYAGPPTGGYNGATININATCSYIKFDCSWYSFINSSPNGSAVAYSDQLIGEYFFTGSNSPAYSNGIYSSYYWGTVQLYLSAFNCYGQATLEWAF